MAHHAWSRTAVPTYDTHSADPRFASELNLAVLQEFTLKAADVIRAYIAPERDGSIGVPRQHVSMKEIRCDIIPRLNDLLQREMHAHRPFADNSIPWLKIVHFNEVRARGTHYGPFLRKTVDVIFKSEGYAFHEAHNSSGYSRK